VLRDRAAVRLGVRYCAGGAAGAAGAGAGAAGAIGAAADAPTLTIGIGRIPPCGLIASLILLKTARA
jgi:hypothetical protein